MKVSSKRFDYAIALWHGRESDFKLVGNSRPERDGVFSMVLDKFSPNEINIFQVGAIESLDSKFKIGSGWSDIVFGRYIMRNGGSLTIVDINLDHLAHSVFMANNLGYPVQVEFGDAVNSIKEGYDIYYLDGADEPLGHQQTLEQFQKIEHTKSLVIVDDVQTKALSLKNYLKEKQIEFELHEVGNGGMMTVDMRGAVK